MVIPFFSFLIFFVIILHGIYFILNCLYYFHLNAVVFGVVVAAAPAILGDLL